MNVFSSLSLSCLLLCALACGPTQKSLPEVEQWTTYEISLEAQGTYDNPYTEVSLWATFTSESGQQMKRPAFWDGGNTWNIRFAPPTTNERWTWQTQLQSGTDAGLSGQSGALRSIPYQGDHQLLRSGLLKMSPGKRNVVHADGTPFLVVGDTPWAIPFRATTEQVERYARDRQTKGFNTALLMTLQPDMESVGPNARNTDQGFVRAFSDLSDGHINQMDPTYFHYLDSLIDILLDHEIVPVYQPVFHGFGWKGEKVLGVVVDADEYVRYCQYLLARYGSQPAFWLLAGDHNAKDPGVKESGEMMEVWDAYQQPTGLHYSPCDDFIAEWAKNDPLKHCMHHNNSWQEEPWMDFQWAQTGHNGDHQYHKVSRMYDNPTVKAAANGEPTYEGMGGGKNGLGWWQGEDAWMQLMSGGTMGVVYGAASLWQWKITADEAGWADWAAQPKSWEEAMQMEGSIHVGLVGQILEGYQLTDIEKRWDLAGGKPLLAKEGELYLSYLNAGGTLTIAGLPADLPYHWVNPKTGEAQPIETTTASMAFEAPSPQPWVLVVGAMG
ncbi:MAG: DUF4038 domain-containing protein [Bacteroidota bacterium]